MGARVGANVVVVLSWCCRGRESDRGGVVMRG